MLLKSKRNVLSSWKRNRNKWAWSTKKTTKGIYLCEQFTRAKVSMLTDNINSRFENVKFRLFTEQINGGLKEDCEPCASVNGLIPFACE